MRSADAFGWKSGLGLTSPTIEMLGATFVCRYILTLYMTPILLGVAGSSCMAGYVGSAGCIDVGWNDWKMMQLLETWGDGKPMLVKVRYEDKSAAVPGTKQSPVAWPLGGGQ
jgi:hypothetical protein